MSHFIIQLTSPIRKIKNRENNIHNFIFVTRLILALTVSPLALFPLFYIQFGFLLYLLMILSSTDCGLGLAWWPYQLSSCFEFTIIDKPWRAKPEVTASCPNAIIQWICHWSESLALACAPYNAKCISSNTGIQVLGRKKGRDLKR